MRSPTLRWRRCLVVSSSTRPARADLGKSKRGTLTTDEKDELTKLRKEVRELRLEREILENATVFFAKENA
jgi:transposase